MLSIFAVAQLIMYAAMHIPVEVRVDRFGSRLMIAAGALVMAAGQALLAVTWDHGGSPCRADPGRHRRRDDIHLGPAAGSNLIFGILIATIGMWTIVLLWPGAAPPPVFVVLILVLAAYGPASGVGFDFARTFDRSTRLGAATGILNMGGFVASLVTIFVIGVILDLLAQGGRYTLLDFKVAFSFQYVVGASVSSACAVPGGWPWPSWPPKARPSTRHRGRSPAAGGSGRADATGARCTTWSRASTCYSSLRCPAGLDATSRTFWATRVRVAE